MPYRGHLVSVVWDRDGTRYKRGKGLKLFADGKEIAASAKLAPLSAKLPAVQAARSRPGRSVNFAVNNDGTYYPRVPTSYSNLRTPPAKLIDGNYWYHRDPPNRWTCEGSPNASDSVAIDFGMQRTLHTVKLYFLDDGKGSSRPRGSTWNTGTARTGSRSRGSRAPRRSRTGRRANVIRFPRWRPPRRCGPYCTTRKAERPA